MLGEIAIKKCLQCGHEFIGGTGGFVLKVATCPRCGSTMVKSQK